MKSEVSFAQRIGSYEISEYATARIWADKLIAEREEVIESLYDDCSPTITGYDYEGGRMYSMSTPVEDMAIYIIDKKEFYDKMINRYSKKAELFEIAMESLTDRERDVIRIVYQGAPNNLGLSHAYFNQIFRNAEDKLSSYLTSAQQKKAEEWKNMLKEQRIKKMEEWRAS
ncbi:MAG TPA: hypothetical protein VNM69_17985 [Bacillus sp. (in: firmicutes)]|nr:hypothetical protein [Bacillus sp. (in: firmicutes)]